MYPGMQDDVSLLVANKMDLYDQQSPYNPDMPLRMLQYVGNLYGKFMTQHKLNKYGDTFPPLPIPKPEVFFNGGYTRGKK